MNLFINDILSVSTISSFNFTADTSDFLLIGGPNNFVGYIDEFKLINGTANEPPSTTPTPTPTITSTNVPKIQSANFFLQMDSENPFIDSLNPERRININGKQVGMDTSVVQSGNGSLSLNTTGDTSYLSIPVNVNEPDSIVNSIFTLRDDFTIDFWIHPTGIPSTKYSYLFTSSSFESGGLRILWNYNSLSFQPCSLNILGSSKNVNVISSSGNMIPLNEWTHVILTRRSDNIKLFINNVLNNSRKFWPPFLGFYLYDENSEQFINEEIRIGAGMGDFTLNNPDGGGDVKGSDEFGNLAYTNFHGYIDEFKFIKDIAIDPTPQPTPTPTRTPTLTPTVTPTPMTIDICQSGPVINLGNVRTTQYYNYAGSGCITNRVINLSGSTGGGTLISSGSGPLIFTSNITSGGLGNKAFTLGGNNTGRNRVNRLRDPSPGGGANGRVRLVKDGSGTWEITGASGNYSGGTTILEGKLIVSGANVSGVVNGPLGIGNITIGNSGTNSYGSASLLLEEGVVFNRNINLSISNPSVTDQSCSSICSPGPSWFYAGDNNVNSLSRGRYTWSNVEDPDPLETWRPSQELIIGGVNTSGVCTFNAPITPLRSSSYGELNIRAATSGTVILNYDIGYSMGFAYNRGTIIFGSPEDNNQGTVISGPISSATQQTMSLVLNGGTLCYDGGRGYVYGTGRFGYTILLRGKLKLVDVDSSVLSLGTKGIIYVGDGSDNIHDFVEIELNGTARWILSFSGYGLNIKPLGTNSTQKIYLTSNQPYLNIDNFTYSASNFTSMGRPITLRASANSIMNFSMSLSNRYGNGHTDQNIYIGSENYTGVVSYNIVLSSQASVIINYGTFMISLQVNQIESDAPTIVLDGADETARFVYSPTVQAPAPLTKLVLIKGILSGTGDIGVPITIGSGITLYPGNSAQDIAIKPLIPASLNQIYTSGISLNSGGKLRVDIINSIGSLVGGTDYNQAVVPNSGVFINSTESEPFVIEINCPNTMSDNTFTIISNSGVLNNFNSNKFNIVNNNPLVSGTFSLTSSESDIILNYIAPIVTQNLFQLHFDELNINNNYDDTGKYSLELIPSGSTSLDTVEKVIGSGSVNFNGGYLNSSSGNLINLGKSKFTVDFWIRPDSVGNHTRGIIDLDTNYYSNRFAIVVRPNGIIGIDNNTSLISANSGLTANEWHHVAIVRENSYNNKTVIYLNGIPDSTGTVSTNFLQSQINIGRTWAGENFVGNLDEFRIIQEAVYTGIFIPT
jgi:autotransporter-associated beta strand protein